MLVPSIALSYDHQNHSKWHKWCHVYYTLARRRRRSQFRLANTTNGGGARDQAHDEDVVDVHRRDSAAHSFKVSMKRGTAAAVGESVSSDTFAVGGHDWRIRYYPRGSYSKTHVGVFLDLVSEGGGVEVEVLCDFRLLDRATKVFSSVLSVERLSNSKPSKGPWGSHWFIKRSQLLGEWEPPTCRMMAAS